MAINPDIRDQAYPFFSAEAPELLQIIETGLLSLSQNRSAAEVHNLMRAAHSLKGGAASVGLETIATLSHRLENIFKALYSETLEIDTQLESQLLLAFDCLKLPLMQKITTGSFNSEEALAIADPILTQLEQFCGDALLQTESYIPSSLDMGVNMRSSILEVDVVQGLTHLASVVAQPQAYEVAGELRAQAEVFAGFAEILNLPGLGTIAATVCQALDAHPDRAVDITEIALADFERSRQAALSDSPLTPSAALLAFADSSQIALNAPNLNSKTSPEPAAAVPFLETVFSSAFASDSGEMIDITDSFLSFDDESFESIDFADVASEDFNPEIGLEAIELTAEKFDFSEAIEADWTSNDSLNSFSRNTVDDSIYDVMDTVISSSQEQLSDALEIATEIVIESSETAKALQVARPAELYYAKPSYPRQPDPPPASLTVRVDSERLERMNNLVGELMVNRDGLSLQADQLQGVLKELLNRFSRFRTMVSQLQEQSDQLLTAPDRNDPGMNSASARKEPVMRAASSMTALMEFDPLEMDRYGSLHSQFQELLEDVVQLEEAVEDVTLFTRQSNRTLEQQQQTLAHLQNEFRWARMLPLGEVLNRFPRVLRDLSTAYNKPVNLKFTGTDILIDKAILEKLYDPLLHLIRNAFDHGIEPAQVRQQQGKPEQGQLEIQAYYKGNQTIIEIRDDGQGLNLDRIRSRAFELGWLSADQLIFTPAAHLFEFIFAPGFSTASQVSELSGRGVGLDVVRSQLQAIKGSVAVTSHPGKGTTFSLHLPLTLTIAKLVICLVGSTAFALSADNVEEVLTPQADQIKQSGTQRYLHWREQIIPTYRLADLLSYGCPLPEAAASKALNPVSVPQGWAPPLLVLRQEQQFFALEVDRLVNEQELVIKPFGSAIAPPSYAYGCTILGDGSLVPIMDVASLLLFNAEQALEPVTVQRSSPAFKSPAAVRTLQKTILVVDDAITLRQTLALSLERAGFRVLQARDGWEAIDQLRHTSVKLVICDIEMPNMNGFEFLSYRRQDDHLSTIPVVMLTSRSNTKHRWLALQLGAIDYFSKPYLEQEFLTAIETIIQQN